MEYEKRKEKLMENNKECTNNLFSLNFTCIVFVHCRV